MSMTTAFTIFAKAAVKERHFPFEISDRPSFHEQKEQQIRREAREALLEIRAERAANNEREWTLDEINAEIDAARQERDLQH